MSRVRTAGRFHGREEFNCWEDNKRCNFTSVLLKSAVTRELERRDGERCIFVGDGCVGTKRELDFV